MSSGQTNLGRLLNERYNTGLALLKTDTYAAEAVFLELLTQPHLALWKRAQCNVNLAMLADDISVAPLYLADARHVLDLYHASHGSPTTGSVASDVECMKETFVKVESRLAYRLAHPEEEDELEEEDPATNESEETDPAESEGERENDDDFPSEEHIPGKSALSEMVLEHTATHTRNSFEQTTSFNSIRPDFPGNELDKRASIGIGELNLGNESESPPRPRTTSPPASSQDMEPESSSTLRTALFSPVSDMSSALDESVADVDEDGERTSTNSRSFDFDADAMDLSE